MLKGVPSEDMKQNYDPISEEKAFEKLAEILKMILNPKQKPEFNKENNNTVDNDFCCCPKFVKFKLIASTVIIINDNAECEKNLMPM